MPTPARAPISRFAGPQQRFVNEYLVDLNATQAAIRAGYAKKAAHVQGCELLKTPKVAAAVAAGKRELAARAEIRSVDVVSQIARQAFFDPRRLIDADGRMIPLQELPDDVALAIQSLKVTRDTHDGETLSTTWEIKFADRSKACDMLMRHLGLFEKDNAQASGVAELLDFIAERGLGRIKATPQKLTLTVPAVEVPPKVPPKPELLK